MKSSNYNYQDFDQCMKCSACTQYCPALAANPIFPGPKHAGPDQERQRLKGSGYYDEALKICLNCKLCEVACPSGIKIGDIIQRARLNYGDESFNLRNFVLSNTDLVGTLSTTVAPVVNTVMKMGVTKWGLDTFLNIDRNRQFPKYASKTFESWYKREGAKQKEFDRRVSYFHGCYVNYNFPKLGQDMIKVMNTFGIGVELLDKEKCCGVALISNGFQQKAKRNANFNMKHIRDSIASGCEKVIATSSSCTMTIRDEYPHLLDIDNSDIRDNVELATRFIYRLIEEDRTILSKLKLKKDKIKVAYHTPCHLGKLGWAYYSIELLKLIPGIELTVLDSNCCGIAGTYGFKKENYQTAQEIGDGLFRQIEEGDYDLVATDCETCKWQIEMSTSAKCEHPLTVMAELLSKS